MVDAQLRTAWHIHIRIPQTGNEKVNERREKAKGTLSHIV